MLFRIAKGMARQMASDVEEIPIRVPQSDMVYYGGKYYKLYAAGPDGSLILYDPVTGTFRTVRQ
ncbi:MAG: hypothetical protein QW680_05815 [Pyrobaculum sp.]